MQPRGRRAPRRGDDCLVRNPGRGRKPRTGDRGRANPVLRRQLRANAVGRGYFDLGPCGPLRTDLADRKDYCGLFRTPSLRNVARRRVFFHNGLVNHLEDGVRFFAERDTRPDRWYPRAADGTIRKFDDLSDEYQSTMDREAPFDRRPGEPPALGETDVADLVAFLNTLTDVFRAARSAGGRSMREDQ